MTATFLHLTFTWSVTVQDFNVVATSMELIQITLLVQNYNMVGNQHRADVDNNFGAKLR